MKYIAYIDGGAVNNPGPAAIGVVISRGGTAEPWKEYSQKLPYEATNNQAEFEAAFFILSKLKALLGKKKIREIDLTIKSDSKLLVRQLTGKFKIQDSKIQALFLKIWNTLVDYGGPGSVKFELIPREQNKRADQLVKQALN